MKTQRERDEERRQVKLDEIGESVRDGTLVIREMTPEEREKHPPRERPAKQRRRF